MTKQPDGYFITHSRITDILHFGPFASLADAQQWLKEHPQVRGVIRPLYLDVDWNRQG